MKTCIAGPALLCAAVLAAPPASAPTTRPVGPAERNAAVETTSQGDLVIQPINHSAIRFEFKGKQYYVDPSGPGRLGQDAQG